MERDLNLFFTVHKNYAEEAECSPYSSFFLSSPRDLLFGSGSLADSGTAFDSFSAW